ncbi:hypothetical protein LWC34_01870 [Kibdelosporangium philippinense]|uniref:Four-carbon acid sugar kinase N-terminal domain-containing protein n=1 Tax=Kibdelosporangium philippinense TaxID=211113 RepID=A0ABS8Z159_9PSEU|nr:four-carbon acid sugar kinase family protein [Kibdelosporangium philippinense]MCE7001595.1 hypothetical protein [Kibdelosporangium philippinense]
MIGTVAEDLGGGLDIACAFRAEGLRTLFLFDVPAKSVELSDAVVIAAADAVEAVDWLRRNGCSQIYVEFGSASVLGAVAEAMSVDTVPIVPSAPHRRRAVYMGHLFDGSTLVADLPRVLRASLAAWGPPSQDH